MQDGRKHKSNKEVAQTSFRQHSYSAEHCSEKCKQSLTYSDKVHLLSRYRNPVQRRRDRRGKQSQSGNGTKHESIAICPKESERSDEDNEGAASEDESKGQNIPEVES